MRQGTPWEEKKKHSKKSDADENKETKQLQQNWNISEMITAYSNWQLPEFYKSTEKTEINLSASTDWDCVVTRAIIWIQFQYEQ